ncbi:PREDICTED: transmembrane protein 135-like [Rhagoletis zephyria]|uniref:transmembrane protein 135-like n=1 Tax=Rhagoletis zephyria TaxID=28612 RepID=UPI00081147C7|nr:PREDICTED: transmembrane protein 135-like [Rhagoletis zephyria]
MVVLSKLFKDNLEKGLCCNDIVHNGSCKMNVALNTYKFLISNMKYFAPVIGLPLLVHIRSLNKGILKSTLNYYIAAVVSGTATGWMIMLMICWLRHIFGKFGKYTFVFWPTFIGSFAMWAVPSPRVHRLFKTTVFQCTIESFVLQQKTVITKLIANSALLRTFIFMCCSGLIMNAKRAKTYKGFWLLEPTPCREKTSAENEESTEEKNGNSQHKLCSHSSKSCIPYALQGMRNYMIIGLTLDILKMLMSKVTTDGRGFTAKAIAKLSTFKIRSCALLTSYIAIYRLLHCFFNQNYGGDSTVNHTAAAFLSGSCFIFYPKLTLLCYALVLGIQISWQHFKAHLSAERYGDTFEWVKRLSYNKMLFPLALAYLVHTYCFRKEYISSLGETIINGLTNNYARNLYQNIEIFGKQLKNAEH